MIKHLKVKLLPIILCGTLCTFCLGLTQVANAQTTAASGGIGGIYVLIAYLNKLVETTSKTLSELMYQVLPSTSGVVANNMQQIQSKMAANELATDENNATIQTLLSQDYQPLMKALAAIPASDTYIPKSRFRLPFFGGRSKEATKKIIESGNSNFDFRSLISPVAYTKNENAHAKNFITTLSLLNQPITSATLLQSIDGLNPTQREALKGYSSFQRYKSIIRGTVALQSVALSNLYQLYAERVAPKNGDSVMQIRQNNATWRLKDPTWSLELAKASPDAVLRSQTLILAEILEKLNAIQNEMQLQRATSSALILELASLTKTNMIQVESKVGNDIASIKGEKPAQQGGQAQQQQDAEAVARAKAIEKKEQEEQKKQEEKKK